MAIRVTAVEVKEIINTAIEEQIILNSFIATASLYVDENLVGLDPILSDATLKRIELYLAAHFVALTEEKGGITSSAINDAKDTYSNVYSEGFQSTRYGQMSITLDTSGTLKALGAPTLKAQFRVV